MTTACGERLYPGRTSSWRNSTVILKYCYGENILPSKDRLSGKHIANYANTIKDEQLLKKQFGFYLKNNAELSNIVKKFEEVKDKIKNNILIKNE